MTSTATATDTGTRWVGDPTAGSTGGSDTDSGRLTGRALPTPAPVQVDPLVRQGNAFYVAVHGLLHLMAAAVAWGSLTVAMPTITLGWLSPGLAAGALATVGFAFLAAAVLLVAGRGWRMPLAVAAMLSTAACLGSLPEAAMALGVNGLIALGLVASRLRR